MTAKTLPVDTFDLVIFGGTGDLALRKLLPGLLRRYADGQIPEDSRILGVARDKQGDAEYRAKVGEALARIASGDEALKAKLPAFLDKLGYMALDATKDEGWDEFAARLQTTGERIRVFYLSTSPTLFVAICDRLRAHGLNTGNARVVIEKPIGTDLASAIWDRIEKGIGEGEVKHRCLIHNNHIRDQWIAFVMLKCPQLRLPREQAVNGLCLSSRNLGCALGGTPRRACQQDFPVLRLKCPNKNICSRRLTRTWSARQDHHTRIQPPEHRLPLLLRETLCIFNRP